MNRAGGFGVGLLIGAAVGGVVAMLYAPRSGEETRAMLRQKAQQTKEKAQGVMEQTRAKVSELRGRASQKMSEARSQAQDVIEST